MYISPVSSIPFRFVIEDSLTFIYIYNQMRAAVLFKTFRLVYGVLALVLQVFRTMCTNN